ncbi:hypothetical protein [Erythrobacter ani]|uniref:Glutathione S-transferase n=1 Tax=Erythrobacter ani TaxID=2827235 RepID=A0ABS6SM49_9SPHN|nr:hypothetical protein [Erythrobacter ani]MBV7266071.1 hypothetical protein [Erythrobacter ani]
MDRELRRWSGVHNAPALIFEQDTARTTWSEILMLAERLRPEPSLLPSDKKDRAWMFGLAHELMGEEGLAWSRRLQLIHIGMKMEGPSQKRAEYLSKKYGYNTEAVDRTARRSLDLLALVSRQLKQQMSRGSDYYFGDQLSAVDIYSAAVMALFQPLPTEQCDMDPASRVAFSILDDATKVALDPILLQHRDRIYQRHLELPLSL